MVDNKEVYGTEKVINIYTSFPKLIKAEDLLIQKHKRKLADATFLDIGIGGGRTTFFIAPIVSKYYGIDYSHNFVSFVAEKYEKQNHVVIEFGDARALNQYHDQLFDFILFSFNGIDCVGFDDRKRILRECFRLLKPNGHFWFSFHNIFSLPKLYSFQWPKNPLNWIKEWTRYRNVRSLNGDIQQYQQKEFCILRDGADFFETEVMYLQPGLQLRMLEEAGFSNIELYNAQTAKALTADQANSKYIDWIYVDCTKK
jgi:ubiquinone/menaquinone biosynthesis C-methylase UbiE